MAHNSHEICQFYVVPKRKSMLSVSRLYSTRTIIIMEKRAYLPSILTIHIQKTTFPSPPPPHRHRVHLRHTCQIRKCSRCLRTERRIDFSIFQLLLLLLLLCLRVCHYLPDLDTMRTGYFVGIRAGVKEKDGYRVHVEVGGERGDHREDKRPWNSATGGLRGAEIRIWLCDVNEFFVPFWRAQFIPPERSGSDSRALAKLNIITINYCESIQNTSVWIHLLFTSKRTPWV